MTFYSKIRCSKDWIGSEISPTSIPADQWFFLNCSQQISRKWVQTIKSSALVFQDRGVDIEISILEVLVHYIKLISITKLTECWNLLVPLLREASNVSIQSQFLLCSAVNHFVQRLFASPDQSFDKKCSKDLQEIVVKVSLEYDVAKSTIFFQKINSWRQFAARRVVHPNSGRLSGADDVAA